MDSLLVENKTLVEAIKDWMVSQSHLPKINDHFVLLFLHSNYYRLPETKTTIESYFTFRTSCKDFFANQDVHSPEMQNVMQYVDFAPLPEPTPGGHRMIIIKLSNTDASRFSQVQACKFLTMCFDLWLQSEGNAEGHIMIYDMAGIHLGHLARLGIFPTKHYLYYIQEALPIRMKGFHMVNIVSFIDKIMFLMKPFLKKELYDMIKLHTNHESLFDFVPQKCLPTEYGGNAGDIRALAAQFYDRMEKKRDQFLTDEACQRVDESKRVRDSSYLTKALKLFSTK